MKEITHYTNEDDFPSGLKSASEVCESVHVSAEKLTELANKGVLPHWRVDGGEPLFRITEVKKFVAKNLMTRCNGADVPVSVKISPLAPEANRLEAPAEIRDMPELKKIPQGDYAPCVYFLCKGGKVVYVGQSISVAGRISQHMRDKDFDEVYLIHVAAVALDAVESAMIRHLNPPLNGKPPSKDESRDSEILSRYMDMK